MKSLVASLTFVTAASLVVGCGKSGDSFSLLSDASSYKQNAVYVPRKVDVLWVIDNSGSMASSQANLAANFQSFISKFTQTNSDFHMAVTTTDAYLAPYYNDTTRSRIRDGVTDADRNQHSSVFVMTPATPNLQNVFITNITQGIRGSGDERVFQSFQETLNNPWNASFRRSDAFLAVIFVSDEDDFSHNDFTTGLNGYYFSEDYNDPAMYPISRYVNYLTTYTAAAGSGKNFSVNGIAIYDDACLAQLQNGAQKKNIRYSALVDATGGQKISLCSDFSQSLGVLSQSIIELSSSFALARIPVVSSIVVTVNDVSVLQNITNGWTYDSASNSIVFHGTSVPANGAAVIINFDPAGVKN